MQSNESLGVLRLIFPSARAGRRPVIGWKHLGGPWPLSDFYRELSSGCITDWKGSDTIWELIMCIQMPWDIIDYLLACGLVFVDSGQNLLIITWRNRLKRAHGWAGGAKIRLNVNLPSNPDATLHCFSQLWSGFHAFNNLCLKLSKFHHHYCPVSLTLTYANQLKLYPHWSIILIIQYKFGHNNRACKFSNKTY